MAGISGRIAAASREGLEDLLERKLLEEKMEQAQQQQAIENQMRTRQIGQQDRALNLRESESTREGEQFERTRRDRANEVGLRQMGDDRKVFDTEAETRAGEAMASDPATPPALRRLFGLKKAGINVSPSADMLRTPEEQVAEETRDLKRIEQEAEIRGRVGAKYRAPDRRDENYVKVETVDDKGNPIIDYMTPEEVRAKGGVRGVPKTTAKAQGPATVDAVLDEIEGLSTLINTGSAGPLTKIGGLVRRGAGALNLDDDVAEYESLIAGFTPIVARAVGHVGVLTEKDVQSVRSLFPRPGDSQTLAQNKLKRVRSLMAKIQPESASSQQSAPAMAPSHGGGAPVDPLGIRRPK